MKYVDRRWARTAGLQNSRDDIGRSSSKGLLSINISNTSAAAPLNPSFSAKLSTPPPPALDLLDLVPPATSKSSSHDGFAAQGPHGGHFDAFESQGFVASSAGPVAGGSVFDVFNAAPSPAVGVASVSVGAPVVAPGLAPGPSSSYGLQSAPSAVPKKDFSVFDALTPPPPLSHPSHTASPQQQNPFLQAGQGIGAGQYHAPFIHQQPGYPQAPGALPYQQTGFPVQNTFASHQQPTFAPGGAPHVPHMVPPHHVNPAPVPLPNPFLTPLDQASSSSRSAAFQHDLMGDGHVGSSDAVNPFDLF